MTLRNFRLVKNLLLAVSAFLAVFLLSFSPDLAFIPNKNTVLTDKTIWFPGSVIKSDAVTGNVQSVIIPLKRVGKLFLIEARIDNETGNFIFDTGTSQLVLNSTYFRKLFKVREESGGITGSTGEVERTIVKNILIPGMNFKNITANISNLGHLENRRGVKILGLFGLSLWKDMEIVIDFDRDELYLYSLDKDGNRLENSSNECKADLVQKIDVYHDVLFIKAVIAGKVLTFCLDTGAESNVISAHAPKNVLSSLTILQRKNLLGVSKDESEVLLCSLNNLLLNSQRLPAMNAIITDLEHLSSLYGYKIDGMLGYDFFTKGKVTVNLKKKELKLCFKSQTKN